MQNKSATEDIADILRSRLKDVNVVVGPERKFGQELSGNPSVFVLEYSGRNQTLQNACYLREETNINIHIRSPQEANGDGNFRETKVLADNISSILVGCHSEYRERDIEKTRVTKPAYLGRRNNNTQHIYSLDVDVHKIIELLKVWISPDTNYFVSENLYVVSNESFYKSYPTTVDTLYVKVPLSLNLSGSFASSTLIDTDLEHRTYLLTDIDNIEIGV